MDMDKRQFKLLTITSLAILVLAIAGCATIAGGGPTQEISVNSNPPGADIFVGRVDSEGNVTGLTAAGVKTPGLVSLSKTGKWAVVLRKEGYKDSQITPDTIVNPWFFGNILIGGIIGSGVDSSTGSINKYDPDSLLVTLEEE